MSLAAIKFYQQRMGEDWQELRKRTSQAVAERLPEKAGEKLAEFQVEKLKVGKFLIGVGVQGITEHKPRTAREAREVIDSGYKIATEAMGLDRPDTQVNIQQNVVGMADFVAQIRQRRKERTNVQPNESSNV